MLHPAYNAKLHQGRSQPNIDGERKKYPVRPIIIIFFLNFDNNWSVITFAVMQNNEHILKFRCNHYLLIFEKVNNEIAS